jgi:predicted transcriptional regulator
MKKADRQLTVSLSNRDPFYIMPFAIATCGHLLKSDEKNIIVVMLCYVDRASWETFVSYGTLVRNTGLSRSTVIRCVKRLVEKGALFRSEKITTRSNKLRPHYVIVKEYFAQFEEYWPVEKRLLRGVSVTPPYGLRDTVPIVSVTPHQELLDQDIQLPSSRQPEALADFTITTALPEQENIEGASAVLRAQLVSDFHVDYVQAYKLVKQYTDVTLTDVMADVKIRMSRGGIKNPAGYLVSQLLKKGSL